MSVSSIPGRIDTVKKVDPSVHSLQDVRRRPHSHQVCRFVFREVGHHSLQDPVHILMALAHRKPSHGISVEIQLCDLLCMCDADILIDPALVDPEQHLVRVDRIRQGVQPCYFIFTPLQPACRALHRICDILFLSHAGRALIKSHCDRGSQI